MTEFFIMIITGMFILILGIAFLYFVVVVPNRELQIKQCIENKMYDDAEFMVQQLLKHEPNNLNVQFLLGEIYWFQGKVDYAVSIFELLLQKNFPNSSSNEFKNMVYRLAKYFFESGNISKAKLYLERIINKESSDEYCHELYADILMLIGNNFSDAVKHYQIAADMVPQNPALWEKLGDTLLKLQQMQAAAQAFSQVVQLDSSRFNVWFKLGEIAEHHNDFEKAIRCFLRSESASDQTIIFYSAYKLAKLYSVFGDKKAAINSLDKASEVLRTYSSLFDNHVRAEKHNEMAEYYLEYHYIDKAVKEWEATELANSNFPDIRKKIKEYTALKLSEFFKDIKTTSGRNLANMLCNFVRELNVQVDSYRILEPECIEVISSESGSKVLALKKQKFLFFFWCSVELIPEHILQRFQSMEMQQYTECYLISCAAIPMEIKDFFEKKKISVFTQSNIQELIYEWKIHT